MTEEKKELSARMRNKELAKLLRSCLLSKRDELQRKVNSGKREINRLAKEQSVNKKLLTDVNKEMDRLGLKINE